MLRSFVGLLREVDKHAFPFQIDLFVKDLKWVLSRSSKTRHTLKGKQNGSILHGVIDVRSKLFV